MKSPYRVLKNQMNGWVRRAKCPCWSASSSALPGQCRGILLFHRPFSGTRCNRNNFAWKMQGWLHPGGSGSSLSTFCVWETSLCAGHTRLAVLLSISWVLAMTVTIFFFFFFQTENLELEKLEFSEHSDRISFQPGQSDIRAGKTYSFSAECFSLLSLKIPRDSVGWLGKRALALSSKGGLYVSNLVLLGWRWEVGRGVGFCCLCLNWLSLHRKGEILLWNLHLNYININL